MSSKYDYNYNMNSGVLPSAWDDLNGFQRNWLNSTGDQQATFASWKPSEQQSYMDMMNKDYTNSLKTSGTPEGIGWNNSTFEGVGSLLGGVGSLAQAWAGLQGVKLGKERLAMQDKQFGANFTNQATLLNNQINKHNNWAAANKIANRYDNIETNYRNIG